MRSTRPLYVDEPVLDTPYLALPNASRGVPRMADLIGAMRRPSHRWHAIGDPSVLVNQNSRD
jgi:Na+/phosphate symporter